MADLEELKHYIFVCVGDDIESDLSLSDFELVVKKALRIYSKYILEEKESLVTISQSSVVLPYGGSYAFPPPYPIAATAIPLVPSLKMTTYASYQYSYNPETGILLVPTPGSYIIKYAVPLTLQDIDEKKHPLFYDVLEAVYKMTVGGSRKRSTLNDLQFTMDGDQMYEEGRAQLENLENQVLPDNSPVWMALI